MKEQTQLRELAGGRLGPLLLKLSWPALVSMTLNALYSVVDRVFIGKGCGTEAMTALTLAFPVMMIFGAFGVWIGAGHGTVISIKLGEGDMRSAERTLGQLVAFKLAVFLTLPVLVWIFLDPILRLSGGGGVTAAPLEGARTYLKIVLFSHFFSHLAFGLSAAMRAEGAARKSMYCMIVGFGTNLVLDPLFIFRSLDFTLFGLAVHVPFQGLGLGIAGAAWATDVAMALSCFTALWFYWSGQSAVKLRLSCIRFSRALVARAMGVGMAPFLQQLMGAAINFSLAYAFALWAVDKAAADLQIASLGVFQSVLIFVIMPVLGAQQGISPILGYNWGARNYERVRSGLVLGFWVTTVACVAACLVQMVWAEGFARWFSEDANEAFIRLAAGDLRLSNCMIWTISINVVATTYFQSIGRPKMAIMLSMLRQGLILLPCIWLLPHFIKDHTFAIWLALPVSDVVCQLATIPPFFSHLRFLRAAAAIRARGPSAALAGSAKEGSK